MRIAIIGIRGLPPRYGGSETMADEIGARLVRDGHEVVVYCRHHNLEKDEKPPAEHNGIRLIHLPSINTKNLDTLTHSFLACWHVGLKNTADYVFILNPGHAILLPILKLFGKRFVFQIDGMDWERKKWNTLMRLLFKSSIWLVNAWSPEVLTDNPTMHEWFKRRFKRDIHLIPHGAEIRSREGTAELEKHGLAPNGYYLFVGRLIPEKGVHHLIDAYGKLDTERPLVIVGGSEYTTEYVSRLRELADSRVKFIGYVFGDGFHQLMSNCYVYVQPSEVEGTSPVLLSAMGYGKCVVANAIPENLYTIGDAGISFAVNDADDLARRLTELDRDPHAVDACGERVKRRIEEHFSWERITGETLELFERLDR